MLDTYLQFLKSLKTPLKNKWDFVIDFYNTYIWSALIYECSRLRVTMQSFAWNVNFQFLSMNPGSVLFPEVEP